MSYKENVERYRLQLWHSIIRENIGYPFRGNTANALLTNKLLEYSRRAGTNHNDAFDGKLTESDLLIGWAGKKLKDKMRAKGTVSVTGKKHSKVGRTTARHTFMYMKVLDKLKAMQAFPNESLADKRISDVQQLIFIRNGLVGELRFVDGEFNEHVFPWTVDKSKTADDVHDAWFKLSKTDTVGYGDITPVVKPFFPKRRPSRAAPESSNV